MWGSNKNESEKRTREKRREKQNWWKERETWKERKEKKSGDKKKSETEKKDENQERKIQNLFMREKEVKRVMLARQPMYLLIPHDYCLSSKN